MEADAAVIAINIDARPCTHEEHTRSRRCFKLYLRKQTFFNAMGQHIRFSNPRLYQSEIKCDLEWRSDTATLTQPQFDDSHVLKPISVFQCRRSPQLLWQSIANLATTQLNHDDDDDDEYFLGMLL